MPFSSPRASAFGRGSKGAGRNKVVRATAATGPFKTTTKSSKNTKGKNGSSTMMTTTHGFCLHFVWFVPFVVNFFALKEFAKERLPLFPYGRGSLETP